MTRRYEKPPRSTLEQVRILRSRGLVIEDERAAIAFLTNNNYYRFSAYTFVFEDRFPSGTRRRHTFFDRFTTFDDIRALYEFDQELRDMTLLALRRLEVAIRTRICLTLTQRHRSGHFHLESTFFRDRSRHSAFVALCRRIANEGSETFLRHYRRTYANPDQPPFWMMIEVLTFGQVSKFFANLRTAEQKSVSSQLELAPDILESWLHALVYTRNICVHHGRLWNRAFVHRPKRHPVQQKTRTGSYAQVARTIDFLDRMLFPHDAWLPRVEYLIRTSSGIESSQLGFERGRAR